jgi:soluble lytic murein transglycosylase-like protein
MNKFAIAGTILLASALGSGSGALARHRSIHPAAATARHAKMPAPQQSQHANGSPAAGLVLAAARRHGVPEKLAYAVASVESGFNPHARSRSGAIGLMGITSSTARGLGCRGSLTNPAANAECGTLYLASILHDQGGNLRRTAALYNQGRFAHRISRGAARYAALVLIRARRSPA